MKFMVTLWIIALGLLVILTIVDHAPKPSPIITNQHEGGR